MAPRRRPLSSMINSPPARRTLGTAGTGARGQEDQGGDSCAALIASVDSFVDGLKDGNRPRAGPSREVTINAVSRSGAGRARDDEVTQARSVVTQGAAPSMKKRAPGVAVVIPKVNLPKPMPLSTRASTRHPSMKLHTKDVNRPSKTGNTAPAPVKPMPSFRLVIPKSNTKRSPSPRAVHTAASGKLAEPLESLSSPSRSDAGTVIPVLESPENLLEAFESDLPVPLHPHVEEPSVVFGNQVETAAPIDYLELPSGDSSDEEEPELQDPLPSLPSSQELPAPVRLDVSPGLPALDATVAPSPASPRSQTAAQSDPTAFCLDVGGDEDDQIEEDLQGDDPFGFAKAERQLQKWRRQGVIQAPELEVSGGADETGNDRDEAGSLSYDQLDELLDSQSPFQPFDDDELSTAVDATALSVPQRQSTPTTKRPTPREPESSPLSALSDYDEPMDVSGLRSSAKRKLASGAHEETDDEQAKGKRPSRRPARKDKGRAKKGHSQYEDTSSADDGEVRKTDDLVALLPKRRKKTARARDRGTEYLASDADEDGELGSDWEDDAASAAGKKTPRRGQSGKTTRKAVASKAAAAPKRKSQTNAAEDDKSSTSEGTRRERKKRVAYYKTLDFSFEEEVVL